MCKRRSVASRFLQERNGFLCQCPRCQAEGFSPSEESGAHRHPTEVAFEKKKIGSERGNAEGAHRMFRSKLQNSKKVLLEFWKICPKLATMAFFFPKPFFFHG